VQYTPSLRRHARIITAALLFLGACEAGATDSYNGVDLTIPTVNIGAATFSNMVVTVASIVNGPAGGAPNGSADSYNPANNELTIPSVAVGASTYNNVIVKVGSLVSIGGVSGADVFTGTDVIIPSVQVLGGAVYNNVVITVGSILSAGGGMPQNVRDVYNVATKQLTIAAVSVNGHVYTNAVITPGHIVAINNVTAAINGIITGAWVQGVTITMSGAASGTTTTDANGAYSFSNLPSGQSFTFTPSLSGYSYAPSSEAVSIPAGSSTTVAAPTMTAVSVDPSFSISGTVSYAGAASGPVYVLVYNSFNTCNGGCSSNGGTFVRLSAGAGTYTIRGLQSGSYTVSAYMDTLGTGQPNTSADPSGSSATVVINSSNVSTGADIALADPTVAIPAAPQIGAVLPGNSSALILYNTATDNNGNENATSYLLAWGTDPAASTGGSTETFQAQGNNATVAYLPNLVNGTAYYFKLLASTSAGSSAFSAVSGPVTIGAPTGSNTVSGTVTFSGTATGPMIVALHSPHGNGGIYYAVTGSQASPPTSGASYSVTGVPSGNYQVAVIIDNNNTGVPSAGDFTYGLNGNASTFAVNGPTTENVVLPSANATAFVQTNYFNSGNGSGYGINPAAMSGTKQVVNVTLMSGPNMAVPFDMGFGQNGTNVNLVDGSIAPIVGQSYGFLVTFSDGSSQILTGSISAVLGPNNVAQNLTASAASGADTPTFSWTAPAVLPSFAPFTYSLQNLGSNNIGVLSSVTSVDLATTPGAQPLSTGSYFWQVQVQDAIGNSATVQVSTPYNAP
jgi:uncharacterized protein (DUF2141 family)